MFGADKPGGTVECLHFIPEIGMKCFFMISGNMRKDALSMVKVSLKGGVIKEYESGIAQ